MEWHRGTSANSGRGLAICEGTSVVAIVNGDGYPIGIGNGPRSEAAANLIVTAPRLLAALKATVDRLELNDWEGEEQPYITAAREAIAAAEADTFAPTMALALQKRTRGFAAWSPTDLERQSVATTRRNGRGLHLTFKDGSKAFIPKGTAEVRVAD